VDLLWILWGKLVQGLLTGYPQDNNKLLGDHGTWIMNFGGILYRGPTYMGICCGKLVNIRGPRYLQPELMIHSFYTGYPQVVRDYGSRPMFLLGGIGPAIF